MKTYPAKKKGLFQYLLGMLICLPFLIYLLDTETFSKNPWIFMPFLPTIILAFWAYLNTYYQVDGTKLRYCSGFFKGEIEIATIKKIVSGKTLWVGLKPALAENGMIITYGRWGEVYLAPENNKELLSDLLRINANIKIIDQKEKG